MAVFIFVLFLLSPFIWIGSLILYAFWYAAFGK